MLNNGATYLTTAGEGDVPLWDGVYAATVVNNNDPLGVGRLELNVPQVLGNAVSAWAVPLGTYYTIPNIGTTVSATFLGGDPSQPTWIGPLDLAPIVIAGTTRVTYSVTSPPSPAVGDIWYPVSLGPPATVGPPEVWTFNPGTSSFSFVVQPGIGSTAIANGQVGTAQLSSSVTARVLGGVTTTLGTSPPLTGNLPGDLFINSTTGQISQYNGTSWVPITFAGSTVIQAGTITGATIAGSTITGNNILAGSITAKSLNVGNTLGQNPYFGGGDTSGWTAFASSGAAPTLTGVATTGGFGYPWAANVAAGVGSGFPGISGTSFAVNAGDPVQVNGWFNTNANLQFTISYNNAGGGFVGQTVVTVPASAGNWQYAAINGNVVAGAVTASLVVKVSSGSTAGTEVFQATGLTVQTKLNGGILTAGTVTALQIQAQTITADQLAVIGDNTGVSNPTFAGGSTASWAAFNGSISAVQPGGSAYFPWAAKFTPGGSNNTGGINGFGPGITGTIFKCSPGNGVNFFAKVYATQTNMSLQIQWYTAAFGFISQTFLSTPVTATTWTDVSWIATPPAGAALGVPIIQMQAASGNLSATTDYFYASGIYVLTSIDGGIINAGTINTAQLNAGAINGMTITGAFIYGGTITSSSCIQNSNGAFFYNTIPTNPVASSTTTGGTVAIGSNFYKVTYTNATGETLPPAAGTNVPTTTATSTFTIFSPPAAGNATGYNVYVSATSGGTYWKQNSTPVAIGTNYVRTTAIATSGTSAPTTASGVVNIAQNGYLVASVTSTSGTDAYSNAYLAGVTSYQFGGLSTTELNGGIITVTGGGTISGLTGGPAGINIGGGSATYLSTAVPWSTPLTVAQPSTLVAETWHTMTLANSYTVGSGGIAQYRFNLDGTVTVECVNIVPPAGYSSGQSMWAIPINYQSSQTVTQNFPIVAASTTAPTTSNTPFVAVRGTGTNTLTLQNPPTSLTGFSFLIRYHLS